jgi:[ribosomal protein S18]-alanine N-acetyltransferase
MDFPTLVLIDERCFPPGVAYDSAELGYFMKRPGAKTLVIEINGRIAGFLLLEMSARRRRASIVTLDVREEFRRRGCATELLCTSEEVLRAHNIKTYELQVDVGNDVALAFYRKHGFEIVRRLNGYYENGNDAWLMRKELTAETQRNAEV